MRRKSGKDLKYEGQQLVLFNERKAWRRLALNLLAEFASRNETFLAEEATDYCLMRIPPPHHPNVWGGLFTQLAREGTVVATDQYRRSARASLHAHPYVVWRTTGLSVLILDVVALCIS